MKLTTHDKAMLQQLINAKPGSNELKAVYDIFEIAVLWTPNDDWKQQFRDSFSNKLDPELLAWIIESCNLFEALGEMFFKRFGGDRPESFTIPTTNPR